MPIPVHAEEEALRRAVQSGNFAGAESAARRYTRALETTLEPLAPAQARQRLRAACELMQWARRSLCAERARLSDELRRVQRLAAYHRIAQSGAVHTWRIDG
jgi:hypothetical protein